MKTQLLADTLMMTSKIKKVSASFTQRGGTYLNGLYTTVGMCGPKGVMDKTLTPSPWTTLMDYPKMDYP